MITATVTKKPKVGFGFQCVGLWGTVKKCDAEPERIRNGMSVLS